MAQFENGVLIDSFCKLINPDTHFNPINIGIHGITPDMVRAAPRFFEIFDELHEWLSRSIVTSHTYFDKSAVYGAIKANLCPEHQYNWIDATLIIRRTWPQYSKRGFGLGNLTKDFDIEFKHHDAYEDARASGLIVCRAIKDSGKSILDWHDLIKPKRKNK